MTAISNDNNLMIGFNLNYLNSTTELTVQDYEKDEHNKEYRPCEHRESDKTTSTLGTLIHLLKSSLGSGILAMPMAFKNAGLVFGVLGTLIVGFFCTHCVHILVKSSQEMCRRAKVPALGFSETAEKVFEYGPMGIRKWSRFAKLFCDNSLIMTYFGTCSVYILFIAQSLHDVLNYLLNINLDVRLYIAIILIPILFAAQIREIKYLVPFSIIANICILITFGITSYFLFNQPFDFDDKPFIANWKQIPYFFCTVIFAMEGIGVIMPIENSMEKPDHFLGCPGVLNTSMTIVVALYTIIGFFGYVRYGDEVLGSITLNLPEGVLIAQIAQILIAVAIFFSFSLLFYIPVDIVRRKIEMKISDNNFNVSQILLRIGFVLIMGGLAVAVPDLGAFIGLVGAIFLSVLGLFIPTVIEMVLLYPDRYGRFYWLLIKNMILAFLAICVLVAGTYVSLEDIYKIYQ